MAIDERSRHELFSRLEEVLGEEHATVLMEHLPPIGWADVATKRDLDQLKTQMNAQFEATGARLEAQIEATARSVVQSMTATMIRLNAVSILTVAGLAFAAARLV